MEPLGELLGKYEAKFTLPPVSDLIIWLENNELPFETMLDYNYWMILMLAELIGSEDYLYTVLGRGAVLHAFFLGYVISQVRKSNG